MPSRKPPEKKDADRNVQYLNVDITKEMKPALLKWVADEHDYWDMLEKALDSTLVFGAKFDSYNECFQCSFTQNPKDAKNPTTLVLIGRGASLFQAFQALMYKYWVVLQTNLEDGDVKNARGITDWG